MVVVTLREVTSENQHAVLALRVAPAQERFVGTVARALIDAAEIPEGKPWYRAIYAGDEPVGFLMLSWNVAPDPPRIIGPWFLWKLLIDERHQGRGYGRDPVKLVADCQGTGWTRTFLPADRLCSHGRSRRERRSYPRSETRRPLSITRPPRRHELHPTQRLVRGDPACHEWQ